MQPAPKQLIDQRNLAIQKINAGRDSYQASQDFEMKSSGLKLFIQGLELLMQYSKLEPNQQIKDLTKPKILQFMTEAENMKAFLNNPQNQSGDFQRFSYHPQRNNNNTNIVGNNQNNRRFNNIQQNKQLNNFMQQNQNNNNNLNNQFMNKQQQQQKQQQQNGDLKLIKQTSTGNKISWDDIAGLETAKNSLKEAVIMPIKFPTFFTGNRKPWKGILLYGPPGTGKTHLARACASECNATFISISSADIISKYVGDSEKQLKQVFEQARQNSPSIIFIDEIDAFAGDREGGGNVSEASNRLKTQFLVEMQGIDDTANQGVLVLGATNLPWSLDSAIRRRFEKRVYIPLPDQNARKTLIENLMKNDKHKLTSKDFKLLSEKTDHFSGADISILVRDACYQPIRQLQNAPKFKIVKVGSKEMYSPCEANDKKGKKMNFMEIPEDQLTIPHIEIKDFLAALKHIKPSVCPKDCLKYKQFTEQFGQEA